MVQNPDVIQSTRAIRTNPGAYGRAVSPPTVAPATAGPTVELALTTTRAAGSASPRAAAGGRRPERRRTGYCDCFGPCGFVPPIRPTDLDAINLLASLACLTSAISHLARRIEEEPFAVTFPVSDNR